MLDREVLVSEDVLRQEMAKDIRPLLDLCRPCLRAEEAQRFPSRKVAGRPVIFCRDQRATSTACSTPAAIAARIVCTEREGNRAALSVHLSRLDLRNDGRLRGCRATKPMPRASTRSRSGCKRPARFEDLSRLLVHEPRRGRAALRDYLAGAKDYIDLVIDQSPSGRDGDRAGVQEYDVAANWKLMVENSVDDYHLPSTHSTWLNFMANSGVKIEPPKEAGMVLPTKGYAVDLGNGHFTTDNVNFRGRPVAKWIPLYGEAQKPRSTTSAASWSRGSVLSARSASPTPTAIW